MRFSFDGDKYKGLVHSISVVFYVIVLHYGTCRVLRHRFTLICRVLRHRFSEMHYPVHYSAGKYGEIRAQRCHSLCNEWSLSFNFGET